MFGKLRRQTHQQASMDHAQTTSPTQATASAGQAIAAPVALASGVAPTRPAPSPVGMPIAPATIAPATIAPATIAPATIAPATIGPFAMQTRNTITARSRTTKDVIALVLAQRPAWTNRLPDVTPAEVAALRAQASASTTIDAPRPVTQPSTVPSMTKGGSSWASIEHR